MTDPKLIEAVARAICGLNGHDPDWPASHFSQEKLWQKHADDAQTVITAYEAARRAQALCDLAENDADLIDMETRAMIAAAKGE